METLLILFGLVILVVIMTKSGGGTSNKTPPPTIPFKPTNNVKIAGKVPEPFDGATQETVQANQIIRGPAYVIDGDSIVIKKNQIRRFGIDAPELDHPYGKKAKWALVRLGRGHEVSAEIIAKDDHGRYVAKWILPEGQDLSAEMIKLGLAIDWPKFSDGVYSQMEVAGVRKRLWLADARQKGRMHVWKQYEERQKAKMG